MFLREFSKWIKRAVSIQGTSPYEVKIWYKKRSYKVAGNNQLHFFVGIQCLRISSIQTSLSSRTVGKILFHINISFAYISHPVSGINYSATEKKKKKKKACPTLRPFAIPKDVRESYTSINPTKIVNLIADLKWHFSWLMFQPQNILRVRNRFLVCRCWVRKKDGEKTWHSDSRQFRKWSIVDVAENLFIHIILIISCLH